MNNTATTTSLSTTTTPSSSNVPIQEGDDNSNPQQGNAVLTSSTVVTPSEKTVTTTSSSSSSPKPQPNSAGTKLQFKIPPTQHDARKLFVGGLPPNVKNEEFRQFFSQYGTLIDSVVMFDRDTSKSRGFGFVTFEDESVAIDIIEKNIQSDSKSRVCIQGKWCEVKASQPKRHNNTTNNNQVFSSYGNTSKATKGSSVDGTIATTQSPENGHEFPEEVQYSNWYGYDENVQGNYYHHTMIPSAYQYPTSHVPEGYYIQPLPYAIPGQYVSPQQMDYRHYGYQSYPVPTHYPVLVPGVSMPPQMQQNYYAEANSGMPPKYHDENPSPLIQEDQLVSNNEN